MATDRLEPIVDDLLPVLVIEEGQQPAGRHPYEVYLAQLTGESLRTMRGCLDRLARILAGVRSQSARSPVVLNSAS